MKTLWKIMAIVLLWALVLAVPGFSATAEGGVGITGSCVFLPEPESPDIRTWWNGPDDTLYHQRNELILEYCDFDDDRLDGEYLINVSWDVFIDFDLYPYWITGHDHGSLVVTDAEGNITWTGRYNGFIDEYSMETMTVILNGVGEYQTLQFVATGYFDYADPTTTGPVFEGYIR